MTTFGDQVYQYGGMPVGGNGILPLMGTSGGTGTGTVFFVDPANGSDSNSGLSPKKALDTMFECLNTH